MNEKATQCDKMATNFDLKRIQSFQKMRKHDSPNIADFGEFIPKVKNSTTYFSA